MPIELYPHQIDAVKKLKSGSILCGGVGSGKSRTALAYFYMTECEGMLMINGKGIDDPPLYPKDLYIITTAKKRDTHEWEDEAFQFLISKDPACSVKGIKMTVDSWNNIEKYAGVKNSFFIFDEQRVVGRGKWVKNFLRITKSNHWILLSATPGDTWEDYIPVFIANGFYKNRTEFVLRHVIYSPYTKYPKIEGYLEEDFLQRCRNYITVEMPYAKRADKKLNVTICGYDYKTYCRVQKERWNIFKGMPIQNASELCYTLRKVVNMDESRFEWASRILILHQKVIIFYNFDYELFDLRRLPTTIAECNGHRHDDIPKTDSWAYLVQYNSGAEGWNCIESDCIIFYSMNYSYRAMVQAAGRIDRLNTPYKCLWYYAFRSDSSIDLAIAKALKAKKQFSENRFDKALAKTTHAIIERNRESTDF